MYSFLSFYVQDALGQLVNKPKWWWWLVEIRYGLWMGYTVKDRVDV